MDLDASQIAYGKDMDAVCFMNEAETVFNIFVPSNAMGRYWVIEEGQGVETRMREMHREEIEDEYHPKVAAKVQDACEHWNIN